MPDRFSNYKEPLLPEMDAQSELERHVAHSKELQDTFKAYLRVFAWGFSIAAIITFFFYLLPLMH